MMVAKYSVFLWWGPEKEQETEVKQRRVKKGSKSVRTMQGRKQGWTEETAWAKGEAWHTLLEHTGQRREKSSNVQRSSPWPVLRLLPWVRTVPFPRAQEEQTPSAPASMKQACLKMVYVSSWLLEPVLWVHVAENTDSNFQHFFLTGLKSGVYKLIKQTQTVVTFHVI